MSDTENLTAEPEPPQKPKAPKGFFAVDWRAVEDATHYGDGINTASAYLALARFTPKDNRTTKAGMTAIHDRTGLSRNRATNALKTLERAGLITPTTKGTSRKIVPWATAVWHRSNATERQQAVYERVIGKANPIISSTDPDEHVAHGLAEKGILEQTHAARGKPRYRAALPEWVWLPNTLVDGFGTGDSPLARLRQIRNKHAIPLLLDCYRLANLAEDGGLPWLWVRSTHKREKIYTWGQFTVWGFAKSHQQSGTWDPLFTRFKGDDQDSDSKTLWSVVGALEASRLIEFVGHIVEGLEDGSQVIHPYALPYTGEEVERQVAIAAHQAGRRMLSEGNWEWAKRELGGVPYLCPVRSHVTDVQLVGILRVTHRPHTRKTAAWAANFLHRCEEHKALFDSLGENIASSVA